MSEALVELGYKVSESHPPVEPGEGVEARAAILHIEGFRLSTYVLADDDETLSSIASSHDARVASINEGGAEE